MPSPRRALLLLAAVAGLALAGCSVGDEGPRTTQARDLDAFTRVENGGSVDVRLKVGERQRVRVVAGEKVIDDVRTEVRDGTLEVTFDHDGFWGDDAIVEASVPELDSVVVDGSGDVAAVGMDASVLEVTADGSGDVELAGTAGRLTVAVDGSGNAELEDLAAREAQVIAGGSGDAEVRVDERLAVEVDGSGDVSYHGDPALTQEVDGSGELSRAG